MNKASERYNAKIEIPISVILETIFSDDNKDVETLCRWAKKYGFVNLVKEDGKKLGYYKLQDDYTKQNFYILLDKEERKQYDYEDYLMDQLRQKENIIEELEKTIENRLMAVPDDVLDDGIEEIKRTTKIAVYQVILGDLYKLKELKESNNENNNKENN